MATTKVKKKKSTKKKELSYFYRIETKRKLWVLMWSVCILSIVLEFFIHRKSHFGDHGIDGMFGFYAIIGFFGCVSMIIIAKFLGIFLKVKEDYYHD